MPELPRENPVCVHHWTYDSARLEWQCAHCSYRIRDVEIAIEPAD